MMMPFDYNYQNALRQAIVFSIFFLCEESLVRDTNSHYKDCSEMHSILSHLGALGIMGERPP